MADPTWLPEVLKTAGLTCDVYPGAMDRGHGDFGDIWGVIIHHTGASGSPGPGVIANHPTLGLCSQLHLDRAGKYTVCGVGIAWHAGNGAWKGLPTNDANRLTIGIEAENNGTEGWTTVQYNAYVKGVAAILKKLGKDSSHVIGHKEWAGPSQGKWDPGLIDMAKFRADVQKILDGTTPTPAPKPEAPVADPNKLKSLVDGSQWTRDELLLFADKRNWRIDKMLTAICKRDGLPYTDAALKQVTEK
jgi:hypothetical protein